MIRTAALFFFTILSGSAADVPAIIAHRGGGALWPENTLAAFRNALARGVPVLEFDMNLTADEQIVIHHDSTINGQICRADKGAGVVPGPIRGFTLAQIRGFECGSFTRADSPGYRPVPGERIPTLDEFLAAVKDSPALLLGETKMPADGTVHPERFVELIDAAIRRTGIDSRFILQSADYRTTDIMRRRNPAVRICLLNSRKFRPKYLEVAMRHGATHLMLRADDVTAEQVDDLRRAGLVLYSGTANDQRDWSKYVEMGFDAILTDDPVALRQYLDRRKK